MPLSLTNQIHIYRVPQVSVSPTPLKFPSRSRVLWAQDFDNSLSTTFNPCPKPLIGQECWMFEDASLWHTIYRTTICCITMYRNIWNHRHRVTCMVPVSRVGQVFGSQLKTASGITVFTQYCAMWKSGKRRPDYKLSKERWWLADTQQQLYSRRRALSQPAFLLFQEGDVIQRQGRHYQSFSPAGIVVLDLVRYTHWIDIAQTVPFFSNVGKFF